MRAPLAAIEPALDLAVDVILPRARRGRARDFLAVRQALREPRVAVEELRPELRREAG